MGSPVRPALRRSSRIAGWIAFAGFELLVLALTWVVASIRCCGSASGASPQSASEWVAFGLIGIVMLLLGAAVGLGAAFIVEGLLRLLSRVIGPRETGP